MRFFKKDHIVLFNGDCLNIMDRLIEKGVKVDAVICDPPYQKTKNKWDTIIPFEDMWSRLNKLCKPNGATILFGQGTFSAKLMLSNEKNHRYNMVWDKRLPSGFLNANRMPLPSHEDVLVFYNKMVKYNPQKYKGNKNHSKGNLHDKDFNNNNYGEYKSVDNNEALGDMKYPRSVIGYETVLKYQKPHPSVSVHPTQKPVELLQYLIETYTDEGATILDFTMGSGSTGVACVVSSRKFIGIELEEKYYNIAVDRVMEVLDGEKKSEQT